MGCEHPEVAAAEISVLFTGDQEIRALNFQYRGKDKATDVLSFAAPEHSCESPSLGDLVISLETAARQARRYRVTLHQELLRLMIHGTLHLFGYDHEGVPARTAQRMRRKERGLYRRFSAELR